MQQSATSRSHNQHLTHAQQQRWRDFRYQHAKEIKDLGDMVVYIAKGYRVGAEYILDHRSSEVCHGTVYLQVKEAEGMWENLLAAADAYFAQDRKLAVAMRKHMAKETRHLSDHAMEEELRPGSKGNGTPSRER